MKLHTLSLAALLLTLPLATGGCTSTGQTCDQTCVIKTSYASAESGVTLAAKGVTTAVAAGAIKPDSDVANGIKLALDGASKALDAANAYIAAGNLTAAQTQITNANNSVADVNSQTGAQ